MTTQASLQTRPPFQGTLEQLSQELGNRTAQAMIEMVTLSEKAQAENSLDFGIWYPNDCIKTLMKTHQLPKIIALRESGKLLMGSLPEKFFGPIYASSEESSKKEWTFRAFFTELPSDALKAAMQGFGILECGTVCQIARYKALNDVLGDDRFNRLFRKPYGVPMNIEYATDDELQPMRYFVSFTETALKGIKGTLNRRPINVGQVISLNGVPTYPNKHFNNMYENFNVVCSDATPGAQKFVAHGLSSKGETEQQVAQRFVSAFNETPDHYTRVPLRERPKIEKIVRALQTDGWKDQKINTTSPIASVRGYDPYSPQGYRVKLIYDLTRTPLEEISMDFVKKHENANHTPAMSIEEGFRQLFQGRK